MLFNSEIFIFFFIVFFTFYWWLKNKLFWQNILILIASYIFYGWWDYRFLALIFISSVADFSFGLMIEQYQQKKKWFLGGSILINLGVLGFFKYYNFFADSFSDVLAIMGMQANVVTLSIVLPVGISFYTFQTLGYTIDVYRGHIFPERRLVRFLAYVSFFPQLVAGPIERAANLLPQFAYVKHFDYKMAVDGSRMILLGFFMKVVIADNLSEGVDTIFTDYASLGSLTLFHGAVFFAFQIYCDFAGYSLIAIGVAKLLGISLMKNFNFPYLSRDIGEFWRRWHISLSTWFRDYVYIPLGGSKRGTLINVRNIFIIFVVSGFWHGANWTFVIWGGLNAFYFLPLFLMGKNRKNMNVIAASRWLPSLRELLMLLGTFFLTCIAWVFFRAENVSHAAHYLKRMLTSFNFHVENAYYEFTFLVLGLFLLEYIQRHKNHLLAVDQLPRIFRWMLYIVMFFSVFNFWGQEASFIYFQF